MRRIPHALLAALLLLAGCQTPLTLGGEWRPQYTDVVWKSEPITLVDDERFVWLWGLIDTERPDVHAELASRARPGERLTDLDIMENTTIPGVILGWITLGIVSHKEVVVHGRRARVAGAEGETWRETTPGTKSSTE